VFINTFCEGETLSVHDEHERPFVFATEVEAQREIVELVMVRLQEFMDGEREFDDAMTTEEYVVEVEILADGSCVAADGRRFVASPG
jgi:hypothetical protein